jgi:hypothetical protein
MSCVKIAMAERMNKVKSLGAGLFAAFLVTFAPLAHAQGTSEGIDIVSGKYEERSGKVIMDVTDRVQEICGSQSRSCQFQCVGSTFGPNKLHHKKICRVIYRCGSQITKSVESDEFDPVNLSCPRQDGPLR